MQKENVVVICPPCGENVGLPTRRGLLNMPAYGVFPPQGREITARGFTLIELLVVVLIIGILAAVALPQYQYVITKARIQTFIPLLKSIKHSEEIYHLSYGEYTKNLLALDIDLPADCSKINDAWKCGTDSMLLVSGLESETNRPRILYSYCPGYNTSWYTCCGQRPLQIEINLSNQGAWSDKAVCYAQNNSALGTRLCADIIE